MDDAETGGGGEASPMTAEHLSLQLSEAEMLSSMFPNPGEFRLDDPGCIPEIQAFVDGALAYDKLQSRIGFSIKLQTGEEQQKSVELVCRLPHLYPSVLPQVFIRAPTLSRSQHRQVSEAIQAHLETLEVGDLLMGPLIEWLQANVEQYLQDDPTLSSDSAGSKSVHVDPKRNMFSRMWIYSHHIYSKIKRKDILEFADELHLSGFSMPGKPGIIVIEGHNDDVETFWGRIRRMQWKKLTMKEKEDTTLGSKTVDDFRKFEGFEEKYFEPRQGKGRGAHADRGLLYHFLAEKGCGHIFNMYFHVDGKMGDGDID